MRQPSCNSIYFISRPVRRASLEHVFNYPSRAGVGGQGAFCSPYVLASWRHSHRLCQLTRPTVLFAARPPHPVRLAGFRLIEAGLEHKPGVDSQPFHSPLDMGRSVLLRLTHRITALVHVLQLASKTGAILSGKRKLEIHVSVSVERLKLVFGVILAPFVSIRNQQARSRSQGPHLRCEGVEPQHHGSQHSGNLMLSLQFEEQLRDDGNSTSAHDHAVASAVTLYYCCRMQAVSVVFANGTDDCIFL